MNEAPLFSLMSENSLSGICCPSGVPTSRLPISFAIAAELRLHAHDKVE